jgi:hypothetical protein
MSSLLLAQGSLPWVCDQAAKDMKINLFLEQGWDKGLLPKRFGQNAADIRQ